MNWNLRFLALMGCLAIFTGGYGVGKRAADRWYAEHIIVLGPTGRIVSPINALGYNVYYVVSRCAEAPHD
jgi:hypothetical protein